MCLKERSCTEPLKTKKDWKATEQRRKSRFTSENGFCRGMKQNQGQQQSRDSAERLKKMRGKLEGKMEPDDR